MIIKIKKDIKLPDSAVLNMSQPELQLTMEEMAFDHLFLQPPVLYEKQMKTLEPTGYHFFSMVNGL
jgi:hypothetical protein